MNKRALGIAAAIMLFIGLMVLQVAQTGRPRASQVVTLPDGSTLQLLHVSYGRMHLLPESRWHSLARQLPKKFQALLKIPPARDIRMESQAPSLGVLLSKDHSANVPTWSFTLADQHGTEIANRPTSSLHALAPKNGCVLGRAFTAFPQRGGDVELRVYDNVPGKGPIRLAAFKFPNPAPATRPAWRPQPPPLLLSKGSVVIELAECSVTPPGTNSFSSASAAATGSLRAVFKVSERGSPSEHWVLDGGALLDSTGNSVQQRYKYGPRKGNEVSITWEPEVWPTTPAWEIQANFMRTDLATFSSAELIEVKSVSLPVANGFVTINSATTRLGHAVRVLGLVQGKGRYPGRTYTVDSPEIRIEVDITPKLTSKRLTLVGAMDERGRKARNRGYSSSNNTEFTFYVRVEPDAKSLDITLAVQEAVVAEFLVKPDLLSLTQPVPAASGK